MKLVIVRHGESESNRQNLFTGWHDVDLTERGRLEARRSGEYLRDDGLKFDVVFTSVLKRAIKTAWIILEEMDLAWIPVLTSWRLNERHYGALEGLNKTEQAQRYGEEQVHLWRRSYEVRPPAVHPTDPRHPRNNPRYQGLDAAELPAGESLRDVVERFVPYWNAAILPELRNDRTVLVVAHGNSLRALVKHVEGVSNDDIVKMNIATGVPRIYQLGSDLRPLYPSFAPGEDEVESRITSSIHAPRRVDSIA